MSLHHRLRTETRAAHDAIEASFDLETSLASLEAYGVLIADLHAFHLAYETASRPYLLETPFMVEPGRAAHLAQDLAALGVPPGPAAAALPIASRPEAIGAAYVVEGSTLGGLVIAKAVETRLGLSAEAGNAFFTGAGRETARRWRGICAALDAASDPATDDRVVAAALRCFAAMQAHLGRRTLRSAA